MNRGQHKVTWFDGKLEPRQKANPAYPHGIDLDQSDSDDGETCKIDLPYPAKRIGHYLVECETCRKRIVVTTAGRRDDPKSVTVNCKVILQ